MNITVIGTGYVGLVSGACMAEMGNHVTCVDVDDSKINTLKSGRVPFYEPGLEGLIKTNVAEGRLKFSTSLKDNMQGASVFFIAVGTPPRNDGSADTSYVFGAAREIGRHLKSYAVIADKSTVPVGTAEAVRGIISEELKKRGDNTEFDVVSNPEFLKEGAAIDDFMRPDRVIIGVESERAKSVMHELYGPLMRSHERLLYMPVRAAEMTKYAANAMLATKISFMNEMANICERMGVDVENVRVGIGSDNRIGYSFIYPGCGYGGSCFPKDVKALIHMAESKGMSPLLLNAVEERNQNQKRVIVKKIKDRLGDDLSGRRFAMWGLSFKPGTDDMREASSVEILNGLIEAGASVCAYDPIAMETAKRELPKQWFDKGGLVLADHQYNAVKDADALVLVTEWKPFRYPDFDQMRNLMKGRAIFDGRNQYDPAHVKKEGFEYYGIGR